MSQNVNEEMKKVVESLIQGLAKQGIKVDGAAVLNMGKSLSNEEEDIVDKTVQTILNKANDSRSDGSKPPFVQRPTAQPPLYESNEVQEKEIKEACYCPDCYTFENFEKIINLENKGAGEFFYETIKLGGKLFDIKYYRNSTDEKMMISPQKETVPDLSSFSREMLLENLNLAVQNKDFSMAQEFLNALTKKPI